MENKSKSDKPIRSLSRTHAEYWKSRLFRRAYQKNGKQCEINDLYVRIQFLGKREHFPLTSTNSEVAARKAAHIYTFLKANGWEKTLAQYKPGQNTTNFKVTIGDYISAVEATRDLRPSTFLNYRNCLRTIAAESFGIRPKEGQSKFDYHSGAYQAWAQRIDGIRLERLTPDRVERWKNSRVAKAGSAPAKIDSVRRTANSTIRCARSLFSSKLVAKLKNLNLPSPLPFQGLKLDRVRIAKFRSNIKAQELITAAKNEIKQTDPEAYKAFVLGLFAGMRKAEIDLLEWRMLDFSAGIIRLEQTEWLHLKTEDSADDINVGPQALLELRGMMPQPTDKPVKWNQFVLVSSRAPQPQSSRAYYRCEQTFDRLNEWLRSQGIKARKPIHELRKVVGSVVATAQGIYAASRFLRHSDITTTSRFYADLKTPTIVGLGKYLVNKPKTASKVTKFKRLAKAAKL